MSNHQKTALFNLIVGLLILAGYLVLLALFDAKVAPVSFAFFALTALTPWLFKESVQDERERAITRRAGLIGGMTSYSFVVVTAMLIWALRFRADPPTIDVSVLPTLVMGACVVLLLTHSSAVLWFYRRPLDVGS